MRVRVSLVLLCLAAAITIITLQPNNQSQSVQAQPRITNTAVPVVIPSTAPTQPPQSGNSQAVEVSPSPTFTPTQPLPNARLVSIAAPGTAILRDFPEDGANIGALQDNQDYQVLGQYFSWYQIQLSSAPNGRAWVYFADVSVTGNLEEIPFIDPNNQPQALSAQDIGTATAQVLFQTPGVAETATAESRILELPQETTEAQQSGDDRPPTYTPPAELVLLEATSQPDALPTTIVDIGLVDSTIQSVAAGDIPPALPIIGFALLGVFGLLISSFRR